MNILPVWSSSVQVHIFLIQGFWLIRNWTVMNRNLIKLKIVDLAENNWENVSCFWLEM